MILKRIDTNVVHKPKLEQNTFLRFNEEEKPKREFIFIKSNQSLIKVYYSEIVHIEGLKDYVKVFTRENKYIIKRTIKYLEENLPSDNFVRVHKSYIVSINQIDKIELNHVHMPQKKIPIGLFFREDFLSLINQHLL